MGAETILYGAGVLVALAAAVKATPVLWRAVVVASKVPVMVEAIHEEFYPNGRARGDGKPRMEERITVLEGDVRLLKSHLGIEV